MKKSGNKYVLAILSGKKCREISDGLSKREEYMNNARLTRKTLKEVMDDGFKGLKKFK